LEEKQLEKQVIASSLTESETAVLGGGCFWCTEAVFVMLRGVKTVLPGYTGGTTTNPTWESVHGGASGHAECVKVEFDPKEITYRDILTVFFGSHDPTSLNKQMYDVGTEYRSVIFYTTLEQKEIAEKFIAELNNSNKEGKKVVTDLEPLGVFYVAENFHKDYYKNNPNAGYCQIIINPKLEKVQKEFAHLLANHPKQTSN
jgi:peptide-methionine (S)-S-oxide reductase